MRAWAWASGLIEFGHKCPDGAIVFAQGAPHVLCKAVGGKARLSYDNKLLVPGIPEGGGIDALIKFTNLVTQAMHPRD